MANPAEFVYERLAGPDDIRVLELYPATNESDPIRCRMYHRALKSDACSYVAMSYAWGSPKVTKVVVDCNGCSAYIPPTLYSALQRLRAHSDKPQLLWADALCINQGETDDAVLEKNSHIPMMDQIFSQAKEVIVDLGEGNNEHLYVLHSLDRIFFQTEDMIGDLGEGHNEHLHVLRDLDRYKAIGDHEWAALQENSSLPEQMKILKRLDLPGADSTFWFKFTRFIRRPWFRRVWIIQEFVLARTVRFMVGSVFRDKSFLEKSVLRAFIHMSWLYNHDRYYPSHEGPARHLEEVLFHSSPSGNAVEYLVSLRARNYNTGTFCEQLSASTALFKASNVRDKAYALLGLASDPDIKKDFVVNYKEKKRIVMRRVTRYLGTHQLGVYPLYHCVGDRKKYESWALNLYNEEKDELSDLVHASGYTHRRVFRACGSTELTGRFSGFGTHVLTLRGCIVDEITSCMRDSLPPRGEIKSPAMIREQNFWLDRAFEWMCSAATDHSLPKDDFVKQCWRTVIADLIIPKGREGLGNVRLRDWENSTRCIDTWTLCHNVMYRKRNGELDESFFLKDDYVMMGDMFIFGASMRYAYGRRLALTKHRRVSCLIPRDAREGDQIAVIHGCPIPFILRRKVDNKGESFRIVGCAYVHGIMDGEAVTEGSGARDIEIC